ncbi:hypothetical protein Cs7R123_12580 [Catellatospora sp. TT07R-123]|nr:hypothetical protein [Catellatospora sp. TT07R-123]GHJ43916.1 hypothetical protein Cs7R123_12580 [Catellatospora sp. TT07R-123]
MYSDRIKQFAEQFTIEELIRRYDADFDVPLRQRYAVGILRMLGAFDPVPGADGHARACRVGAHWCEIVRCDIGYDLIEGLRFVDASSADAELLVAGLAADPGRGFDRYAAARWHDGAGKIRYRLGSYARARMGFETAVALAEGGDLWWCLPDLRSNLLRASFDEERQAAAARQDADSVGALRDELIDRLHAEIERVRALAAARGLDLARTDSRHPHEQREFARGYSSVLYNLAYALRERSQSEQSLQLARESLRESLAVSLRLGDRYRIAQSRNQQALAGADDALELFEQVRQGDWPRGRMIARQQLADRRGGEPGADDLRLLLSELAAGEAAAFGAGTDIELHAYTVQVYEKILTRDAGQIPAQRAGEFSQDLDGQYEKMERSVRRAVAMPAYKRAYAKAVRPRFLARIHDLVGGASPTPGQVEEAFGLAEESSARELLDMLASAGLPQLDTPPSVAAPLAEGEPDPAPAPVAVEHPATRGGAAVAAAAADGADDADDDEADDEAGDAGRRAVVRSADSGPDDERLRRELAARETEFEQQFLQRPLEAAPHDPEIAHRVRMYTANNPGTCVVRYVAYGPRQAAHVGAFVFRGNRLVFVPVASYAQVRELAGRMPTDHGPRLAECRAIWDVLIAPVWDAVNSGGTPDHLVLVPTDDVFAVPLHVATEPGTQVPLAARLPLSQSVSATAYVGRGRHLLRRQPVSPQDDLAAIVVSDGAASGRELARAGWPAEHLIVVGERAGRGRPGQQALRRRSGRGHRDHRGQAGVLRVRRARPVPPRLRRAGAVPDAPGRAPHAVRRGAAAAAAAQQADRAGRVPGRAGRPDRGRGRGRLPAFADRHRSRGGGCSTVECPG